jgi:adenylate cyclase
LPAEDQPATPPGRPGGIVEQLTDSWLGGSERYTPEEVAAMTGVDRAITRRLWRAMGLADNPDGEAVLGPADLEAVRRVAELVGTAGLAVSDIVYLARVLGLATSQMADSVIGFQAEHLGAALSAEGHRSADGDLGAEGDLIATEDPTGPSEGAITSMVIEELDELVAYLLHRHLLDAVARRLPTLGGGSGVALATTVGFADLVGYTALSQDLSESEIAALVERFEAVASDRVVAAGGRVVKMIGDAVMFAAGPRAAAEIALDLSTAFDGPDVPRVRVGLASGRVVSRAGDLFGPVVNLASRASATARPGSVLVAPDLAADLAADPRFALQRIRPRRLKGIGLVTLSRLAWGAQPETGAPGPAGPPRPAPGRQAKRAARER